MMERAPDGVRIRPMRDTDAPAALEILEKWNMAPTPDEPDAERTGILVENSFVAEVRGHIRGVASFIMLGPEEAETASLAVHPESRGLGLGYRLQVTRLEAMWERGVRQVRTETDRPDTVKWYVAKFGYRNVGTNPKKHAFSLPDVQEWVVLELDLERWIRERGGP